MKKTKNFKVEFENQHILYSKIPLNNPNLRLVQIHNLNDYSYAYTWNNKKHEFINDCLIFAEGLSIDGIHESESCLFVEKETGFEFGNTDYENINIVKIPITNKNQYANPKVGEAYAVVRDKIVNKKHPYHIGYVLLKDGNYNITLEANANDKKLAMPIFDIYNTDPNSGDTFYDFNYTEGNVIILTPKENKKKRSKKF
jgi:hypothetical protein